MNRVFEIGVAIRRASQVGVLACLANVVVYKPIIGFSLASRRTAFVKALRIDF